MPLWLPLKLPHTDGAGLTRLRRMPSASRWGAAPRLSPSTPSLRTSCRLRTPTGCGATRGCASTPLSCPCSSFLSVCISLSAPTYNCPSSNTPYYLSAPHPHMLYPIPFYRSPTYSTTLMFSRCTASHLVHHILSYLICCLITIKPQNYTHSTS
jgi:hypothetical protein